MLSISAAGFLVVLSAGYFLMRAHLMARPVKPVAHWIHGLSAFFFLGFLFIEASRSGTPLRVVTGFFIVVFFIGIFLLTRRFRKQPFLLSVALFHALLGVVAFLLLLASLGTQ